MAFTPGTTKSTISKTLLVGMLYSVILVMLVKTSTAWFSPSNTEQSDPREERAVTELADAVQKEAIRVEKELDSLEKRPLEPQETQVQFICGLISVYQPFVKNCGPIARAIVEVSAEKKVDPFYVAAIVSVESRFYQKAKSKKGAIGLMQLLPSTAKEVANRKTGVKSYPHLLDPHTNVRIGVEYVRHLERQYAGNRYLALAAYNWGPKNVHDARRQKQNFPGSVQRYASQVLEQTLRWRKQYSNAVKTSKALLPKEGDKS